MSGFELMALLLLFSILCALIRCAINIDEIVDELRKFNNSLRESKESAGRVAAEVKHGD